LIFDTVIDISSLPRSYETQCRKQIWRMQVRMIASFLLFYRILLFEVKKRVVQLIVILIN